MHQASVTKRFRAVRHSDHVLPAPAARGPLVAQTATKGPRAPQILDVRAWRATAPIAEQFVVPSLLVHAPRRTGKAVERNRFKRRTRMALLKLLQENPALDLSTWIIWVRPAKGSVLGCRVDYIAIEGQLRLALSRLG
jgi:ribonuclease P protein component